MSLAGSEPASGDGLVEGPSGAPVASAMTDFVELERVEEEPRSNPFKKFVANLRAKAKADLDKAKATTPKALKKILHMDRDEKEKPEKKGGPDALTPQQLKKLKASFDLFDADNSGGIDAQELAQALENLGHRLTRRQVVNIFNCLDHDGNGHIDFDEFADIMRLQRRHERWLTAVQAAFDAAVKSKPDEVTTLTYDELRAILVANADAEHTPDQINRLVALADTDGDGSVDYEEFQTILTTNKSISDIFPCQF